MKKADQKDYQEFLYANAEYPHIFASPFELNFTT